MRGMLGPTSRRLRPRSHRRSHREIPGSGLAGRYILRFARPVDSDLLVEGAGGIRAAKPPRSILDLATSVLPYLALWVAMYFSLRVSYLLTLALAVPAAGFLLRTYIMFHDCATARSCLRGAGTAISAPSSGSS